MKDIYGFSDLNVLYENEKSLILLLKTLCNWGYRNVAINQVVEEIQNDDGNKKKKKKKGEGKQEQEKPLIPLPVSLENIPQDVKNNLKIFQRITVYFSTMDQSHKIMQSENLKLYDIFAVVPTSQVALQHACGALDVDVIAMDPASKSNYMLSRKLYNMAVERNIFFELTYGSAISGSSPRKQLFMNGHNYHVFGKCKNIIVSSGSAHAVHLRGPYDVINLGHICGLSQGQAKQAITSAARSVILKGESRKRGKAVVFVELVRTSREEEEEDETMDVSEVEEDAEEDEDEKKEISKKASDENSKKTEMPAQNKKTSPKSPHRKKVRRE